MSREAISINALIALGFIIGSLTGSIALLVVFGHSNLLSSGDRVQWETLLTGAFAFLGASLAFASVWLPHKRHEKILKRNFHTSCFAYALEVQFLMKELTKSGIRNDQDFQFYLNELDAFRKFPEPLVEINPNVENAFYVVRVHAQICRTSLVREDVLRQNIPLGPPARHTWKYSTTISMAEKLSAKANELQDGLRAWRV